MFIFLREHLRTCQSAENIKRLVEQKQDRKVLLNRSKRVTAHLNLIPFRNLLPFTAAQSLRAQIQILTKITVPASALS